MFRLRRRELMFAGSALASLPLTSAGREVAQAAAGSARSIAVCFGSGSIHGYAHVGAIRAFEQLGFKPQIISGTSVGAIAGVLWAAGLKAAAIEKIADDQSWHEASGLRMPRLGLKELTPLQEMLDTHLDRRPIEALPTRFCAVATDLDNGQPVALTRGDPGRAVAASASVPIRYEPMSIDGRRLVDGALSAPVPVDAARSLGAEFAVAIDVAYRPYEEPVSGITGVAFQMFHIMVNRLIDEQIRRADFAIRLDVHHTLRDEGGIPAVIRAGEEAVLRDWPKLQRAIAAGRTAPSRQARDAQGGGSTGR